MKQGAQAQGEAPEFSLQEAESLMADGQFQK